jgi:hypothetical protein
MKLKTSAILAIMLGGILSSGIVFSQSNNSRNNNLNVRVASENGNGHQDKVAGDVYSYFEVSEEMAANSEAGIEVDPAVPEGLVYRIQVAAFRRPVAPSVFKGLSPIYAFSIPGSDLRKYYVGMFRRISDARDAIEVVKAIGFGGSYISAFEGGSSVSGERAAELEKEWGKIPFEKSPENINITSVRTDTLPASVISRDEISGNVKPTVKKDSIRKEAVRFFIDCRSCDLNFTRQEIPFVNYVRDTREAEVYLLVTSQPAGSGGNQYTFAFQGLEKFAGMDDTLTYTSNPDETSAIVREKKTNMIKMGLMRYVARTPYFDEIDIKNTREIKQHEIEDKWNNWVFELQTNPSYNGEETYKRFSIYNTFQITRVTPDFKLEIELNQYSNKQTYIEDTVTTEYLVSSKSIRNLFVKSLGDHWSAGLRVDMESSTSQNYDLNIDVLPTIEYDIYPYSEATHRQFRILYSMGYEYSDYSDTTIYNKMNEGLFKHSLSAAYQIQKKWGSINFSAYGSNYLKDFSKNRFGFWGYTRLRIIKGLSLSVNTGVTYINNQLNLARGELSEAERLLRLKQQATNFYLNGGVSLSYTFGSIYNNVVNPRFGINN